MTEPKLDDDIAIGKGDTCDDCTNFIHTCECWEDKNADRMHDEMYED